MAGDKERKNEENVSRIENPSRDFSPNLKQDLSGLSGFFRQLRSKSCFKILSVPLKNRAMQTAQKPRKI